MTRKEFFKKLGIGAVIAVVAPKVIAEIAEEQPSTYCEGLIPYIRRTSPPHVYANYDLSCPEVMKELSKRYGGQSFIDVLKVINHE